MELRQLEYFVAVAEEANFTRAAERVQISQSGVSAQIRRLEGELGAALIDRSGRTATLTSAGEAALKHARDVLASATAVRQSVDGVTGVVRGRLVVGMVTACTVTPLFDALAAFHQAHPGVEIALAEDNSDLLIERIHSGVMDLALVGVAGRVPPGLDAVTIISEGLALGVPPGHALAGRSRVTLAEVAAHPVVSLPIGTGVRAVFDQECAAAGLHPDIALQASSPEAIVDLAVRGLGAALLSETMAGLYTDRVDVVPITDLGTAALLALVWAERAGGPNPALRQFLRHCRAAFQHL
jgi:DNA-binding transcriptional LysR family regulator